MSTISDAIRIAYPDAIVKADGTPFVRPAFTGDTTIYKTGFYWQNADGDRFYFSSYEAAAEDIAQDMGFTEAEANNVLAKNQTIIELQCANKHTWQLRLMMPMDMGKFTKALKAARCPICTAKPSDFNEQASPKIHTENVEGK